MIHPFRGLRPTARAGTYQDIVTQPYDKIRTEDLSALRERSPFCAVHLIRGERHPGDTAWYPEAAKKLERWILEGALALDASPAFYVLRQEFHDPAGSTRRRTAVIGALDLGQRHRVHAHERTHVRAREDRYHLLEATRTHFGLVFLLRAGGAPLDLAGLGSTPLGEVLGLEGADHRLERIDDPMSVAALAEALAPCSYVIADGHHRFATACRYADEHPGADRVLAGIVDVDDPGLVILPTHRLVTGVGAERAAAALAPLGLEELPMSERPWDVVAGRGPGTIGFILAGKPSLLLWRIDDDGETGAAALDVSRLEVHCLGPLLAGRETEDHLTYHRDPLAAWSLVQEGRADLLVLLAPLRPKTVAEIALAGEVMPQKSTDFYPKLPTGFVFLPAAGPGP